MHTNKNNSLKISELVRRSLSVLPEATFDVNAVYAYVNTRYAPVYGYDANMSSVIRTWNRERKKINHSVPVRSLFVDYRL